MSESRPIDPIARRIITAPDVSALRESIPQPTPEEAIIAAIARIPHYEREDRIAAALHAADLCSDCFIEQRGRACHCRNDE